MVSTDLAGADADVGGVHRPARLAGFLSSSRCPRCTRTSMPRSCAPRCCCSPACCCRRSARSRSREAWVRRSARSTKRPAHRRGRPRPTGRGAHRRRIAGPRGAEETQRMTGQLRESYAGLERKVDERTAQEFARAADGDQRNSARDLELSHRRAARAASRRRAAHLCGAPFARVMVLEGDVLYPTASYSWWGSWQSRRSRARHRPRGRGACNSAFRRHAPCRSRDFPMRWKTSVAWDAVPCWASRCSASGALQGASSCSARAEPVLAGPGRAGRDVRAAGYRSRDRQRAPVQRDEGGARSADGDQRDPARHLEPRATSSRC